MKYRVEIVRGVNKGRIMDIDEDKAEQFVAEHKVRILKVITNDAPPAETPGFIEVSTEVSGSIDYHELTPEATGDELEDEERCSALTKSGERCKNACVEGNHCRLHVTKVIAPVQIDAQALLVLNKE
jgi:hypothetical protein